jgi:uncharacterized membrane protein YfbV (UPF0208 family)
MAVRGRLAGLSPAVATATIHVHGPVRGMVWIGALNSACAVCTLVCMGRPWARNQQKRYASMLE